jgi:multicomponent K+:H+ antiporter subunit G
MNDTPDLPVWAAVMVGSFVLTGAFLTFIGCVGLVRLKSFYHRIHAPTIGTSFGTLMILTGSALCFSVTQERLAVHEALIFVFVSLTTPATFVMLARAALYRDRSEYNGNVPPPLDEVPDRAE